VFPLGIFEIPCVACGTKLSPSLVTALPEPDFGLLVTKDVNEPDSFQELTQKRPPNSKIHLITQYFRDSSEERQKELDFALERNIACKHIDIIHLLQENDTSLPDKYKNSEKIKVTVIGHRWKFIDAFKYCNSVLADQICVVSNSDIFFDHSLNYLHRIGLRGKFFALTRVDLTSEGTYRFNEWTAPICQDTWIFQPPLDPKLVERSDFYFGWRGCDNHVAWLFREFDYHIVNPCLKIITRHVHATEKRNQGDGDKVVGEFIPVPPNGDV